MSNTKKQFMKAAVFTGPGQVRIDEVPIPTPALDEALLRLHGSGVCASNLAHWQGMPWSQYPMEAGAMGHEAWGTVVDFGSAVTNLKVGDRVTGLSYHAYAEYDVAKADALLRLPQTIGMSPFPGEALGCAFNIFRRGDIRPGETIAIVGIGFLGALLTQLASRAGARVIAISRRPFSLEIAKCMGAHEVIPLDQNGEVIERVKTLTSGRLCDRVIEAVGKQQPLDLSAELTREYGKLIIAGYHQDGPRQVNLRLWNWRALEVVNAHERAPHAYLEGIRAAIDAVAAHALDPSRLYTHAYPLEKLAEAMDATRDRPEGFLKALIIHE